MMAAPAEGFYATLDWAKTKPALPMFLKKDLVKAMDILKAALEAYPGRVEPVSGPIINAKKSLSLLQGPFRRIPRKGPFGSIYSGLF